MDFVRPWLTRIVLLTGLFVPAALAQETKPPAATSPATNQTPAAAVAVPDETEGKKLFSEIVRPVLEQTCLECHGGKRTRSGFDLSTREGLLKGGDNGIAVVLQDAESSRLVRMLRHKEDPGMPYKKPPLDEAAIAKIAAWIAAGAPYDSPLKASETASKTATDHESLWSVQPLTNSPVPAPEGSTHNMVRSPIDAFVLARLREKHLSPAPEADRRTLIRRLTFDLYGLPPTPEEVSAFIEDQDPNAYENLVDRLLASPRYGERWARHWLDVVHYADTHGYDKDRPRTNAWPYRDYVIKSFNSDKAYGRFAAEQLAGDVLFPNDPDALAATGFIVAGPWDLVGHSELKEGTTDKKITRVLDRDDMVANTISTFCSLTIHCARCHNHKFDPMTQKDYYSLQAVFAGIDRADRLYDPDPDLQKLRATLSKEQSAVETDLARLESDRTQISSARIRALNSDMAAIGQQLAVIGQLPSITRGFHSKIAHSRYQSKWVQVDLGQPFPLDQIALLPVNWPHGNFPGPGYGFPQRFRIELSSEADFKTPIVVADETAADFPNPGDSPYLAHAKGKTARYIRVTATRTWRQDPQTNDWIFALSELVAMSRGKNVARGAVVSASDTHNDSPLWQTRNLVDGTTSRAVLFDPSPTDGFRSEMVTNMDTVKWVQLDLGKSLPINHVALMPARSQDQPEESGYGFPIRFRLEASDDPDFKTSEMLADRTTYDVDNPGRTPMSFPCAPRTARYVRITATKLWKEKDKEEFLFALSEVQVLSGETNVALGSPVQALDSRERDRWGARFLTDGFTSLTAMADLSPGDGFLTQTATNGNTAKWVEFDLGVSQPIEQISLVPARSFEDVTRLGFGFPERFRIETSDDAAFESPSFIADYSETNFPNPGLQTQTFSGRGKRGRFVRITATRLWKKEDDQFIFALGEVEILSGPKNFARTALVTASDSVEKERWGTRFIADGFDSFTHLHEPPHPEGYKSASARKPRTPKWVQLDLGKTVPVDLVRLFPLVPTTNQPARSLLPIRFRVEISSDPSFAELKGRSGSPASTRVIFETRTNLIWRSTAPFEIPNDGSPARYVRITATELSGDHHEYSLGFAEAQVLSEGRNVAIGAHVEALDSVESPGWGRQFLTDGFNRDGTLGNVVDVLRDFQRQRDSQQRLLNLAARRDAEIRILADPDSNRALDSTQRRAGELDVKLAALPAQKAVFAAANDFPEDGTFTPVYQPRPVHLLARGDVNQPGDLMKPAALACVRTLTNEFNLAEGAPEGERRAALAKWITDPANAITWRSIVNRVWSYHFGRGLVDTPNDFGNMGSAPTHPELLDYLATEFLAHGQSLKWLHRQVLTSATYRQSSAYSEDFARIDTGNQFLWRMNRDRLDAESLRDSILSVCGKLDLKMGGPGFDLFEFKDDPSPHYFYDRHPVDDPKSLRRSVYRFIVRSVPDPFMETLDCADPSQSVPIRNTTITALQALSLLNNPFVVRMSEVFAERLKKDSPEPTRQVEEAFLLLFGRKASSTEIESFAGYASHYGLANACRLLFNSNEFIFVD